MTKLPTPNSKATGWILYPNKRQNVVDFLYWTESRILTALQLLLAILTLIVIYDIYNL